MRLLIVDDSAGDRKLCRTLMEEAHDPSLEFFEAGDGASGLEACRTLSLDCVLVDYKLPDMTGIEFLKRLPEESKNDRYAIVMLTGMSSGDIAAAAALKAGAHEYIMKDHLTAVALRLTIEKATTRRDLIRDLKAERDRLAGLLSEKEVLLKEVHHRVKNNLAVIASLLSLEASRSSNEGVASALRASQHRVESMALIHEQLYATDDLSQVNLVKHATILAANLFLTYGVDPARIACQVTMEPLELGLDQAIPVGLILGELVSNALKHAFPDGHAGSIVIGGGRCNGGITLTVTDDGVGIPDGDDFERRKSFGMQIVKILTRQLKGTFEVANGHPAIFKISFPEAVSGPQIVQSAASGR